MNSLIIKKIFIRFYISLFMLLFAFLALCQTTYAWIVLANEGLLDGAQLSIISDSGFYVSLDGFNFKESINKADLDRVISKYSLRDVTTTDGINFTHKDGSVVKNPSGNYISFLIWFKTDDPTAEELFLVDNKTNSLTYEECLNKVVDGTFVVSKGVKWISDIDFSYGEENIKKGSNESYFASNAMRIAVIEEQLEEHFGVSEKENLKSLIFDPTENEKMGYGATTGAFNYEKIKLGTITLPKEFPNTKYSLTTFKNPYVANDDNSLCASFQKVIEEDGKINYYTKVRVNIWLEGWDADCFNSIFADEVMIQLKFKGSSYSQNYKREK